MKSFRQYVAEGVSELARISPSGTTSFWFNPKTNDIFFVPGNPSSGPWHATIVAQNPRKFGTTKEEILKYMEKYDRNRRYQDDFEETAKTFYKDILDRERDISDGIFNLMGEKGFFRCTLTGGKVFAQLGSDEAGVSMNATNAQWRKLVEMFSLIKVIRSLDMVSARKIVTLYASDFEFFAKYGRVPQRTEIGSRMAQFREETELSEARKKIRVFDFDDTLVKTDAYVIVTDRDGNKKNLSPAEYAVYVKKPGEVFDYSQFLRVTNPKPMKAIEKILREVIRSGSQAEILTARVNYEPIKAYLKMRGIEGIFVHTLASSDPKLKGAHLQALINSGYDFIEFFDDSPKNIEAAKEVAEKNKGKAKIRLRHIR